MNGRQNRRSGIQLLLHRTRRLFLRGNVPDQSPEVHAREVERRFLFYALEQRKIEQGKKRYGT
jgi:hypothetical protein